MSARRAIEQIVADLVAAAQRRDERHPRRPDPWLIVADATPYPPTPPDPTKENQK